ncbi:MAG: phosphatidylglycerol lysyltransferase domain-containing protein [Methanomicrobiaceae archaeon]|nr:phosphatidylglycerol lysyltransferase domain-containing protein [Methanomicrobiaceae archaeon]
MLHLDDFQPVSLTDRDTFRRIQGKHPPVHSDNTFTNMVCWNHYAHYRYALVERTPVVATTIDNETSFRILAGPGHRAILKRVLSLAAREGGENAFHLFGEKAKEVFERRFPSTPVYPDRDFFDYVYTTAELATLPGKKYLSIRRHLNRFRSNCLYDVEAITADNLADVREFLEKWCVWKECDENPVLGNEKGAVMFAMDHFCALDLSGLLLRVDGQVSAMAIYEMLDRDTAVVHFEKALPDCPGIYKGINQETARTLFDEARCINRESDLGVPGLREAKLRYHPSHFVEVYYVKRDEIRV